MNNINRIIKEKHKYNSITESTAAGFTKHIKFFEFILNWYGFLFYIYGFLPMLFCINGLCVWYVYGVCIVQASYSNFLNLLLYKLKIFFFGIGISC